MRYSQSRGRRGSVSRRAAARFALPVLFVGGIFALVALAQEDRPHRVGPVPVSGAPSISSGEDSAYAAVRAEYAAIRPILARGCFDCHSANTRYPWYYRLPVIKGMIDDDIRRGRKRLDMTDGFPFKGRGSAADHLVAIRDEITEGEMPPRGYRLFHWDAKPSAVEADSVMAWIRRSLEHLAAHGHHPAGDKHEDGGEGQ